MKKIISVMLCVILALSSLCLFASADNTKELQFNKNGKFRILQITDIQDGPFLETATKDFLSAVVEETNPDLIILTGDNISGGTSATRLGAMIAIDRFMSIFESYGIPVAAVFGNHDSEGLATKEDMMKMYEKYDCFIGCDGEDLTGCGNYNIPIKSSDGTKTAYNIFCIDSLTYNDNDGNEQYKENDLGGYACVHKDQIDWYKKVANELKAENGGVSVPSMVFQHIVVPEIFDVCTETDETGKAILPEDAKGTMGENPCPPNYSNGEFQAMVEQGDVVAMFFGHDHTNSYELNYQGIDLVNTPGAGFHSYGSNERGARIIDLDENDLWSYETKVVTWLDVFDAENNEMRMNEFILFANEYSTSEKISAFFKYVFARFTAVA